MGRRWLGLVAGLILATACGDSGTTGDPVVPQDAGSADAGDASPSSGGTAAWSDFQKCDNMCQAYCVRRYNCTGGDVLTCRMTIDDHNGGTCQARAPEFDNVTQARVQACIDALEAMSCPAFDALYDHGVGVPAACKGILS